MRLPSSLDALEPTVRRLLKENVVRGHVEITWVSRVRRGRIEIDRKLLAAYLKGYQTLKKEFGSAAEPDLMALLRVPGWSERRWGDGAGKVRSPRRSAGSGRGAGPRRSMRCARARAQSLERDLRARFEHWKRCGRAFRSSPRLRNITNSGLEGRIRDLAGTGEMDKSGLDQEVAYLASRSDIAEELTRFQSHLDQVRHLLEENSEVGKKLDFLLQEMNREANTLLSKTTDVPEVGLEITRQAIEMKTEIEKLREQALNIE